ncbi:hypothetical protein HU751_022780 [Pseudomonas sp. BW13M1]|uniref:Uncharacterized protein n=1 Tax=Pseudomonas peradeniyensis TaxID=2745488 RepID=A0A923G9W3_9PSED|nr:hypothetical protein [Pseudomonas peradeniyensis]MBV4507661.1 hypothetical protein [Pseudomonas peradeniyensis]
MSLQNAKRVADLNEKISQVGEALSEKHDGIRQAITDETMAEFISYLSDNGFAVSDTVLGKKATYKDLTLELRAAKTAYVGCYHSFDLLVNGKEIFVRVHADLGEDAPRAITAGTEVERLEAELQRIEKILADLSLESYVFAFGPKPKPGKKVETVQKNTITEVVDHLTA